jgi:hypothetical protein
MTVGFVNAEYSTVAHRGKALECMTSRNPTLVWCYAIARELFCLCHLGIVAGNVPATFDWSTVPLNW